MHTLIPNPIIPMMETNMYFLKLTLQYFGLFLNIACKSGYLKRVNWLENRLNENNLK